MTQILNNVIVLMVLYCAQKLLGWEKSKTLYPPSLSKAAPFTLERHIWFESLKMQGFRNKIDALLNHI